MVNIFLNKIKFFTNFVVINKYISFIARNQEKISNSNNSFKNNYRKGIEKYLIIKYRI